MNMTEEQVIEENKYEVRIKSFADKLEYKINDLQEKKRNAEESVRTRYDESINAIQSAREDFLSKTQKLRDASGEEWNRYSDKVDTALESIEYEIDTAYEGIRNGMTYLFDKFKK